MDEVDGKRTFSGQLPTVQVLVLMRVFRGSGPSGE